jgi:hypothetical protein
VGRGLLGRSYIPASVEEEEERSGCAGGVSELPLTLRKRTERTEGDDDHLKLAVQLGARDDEIDGRGSLYVPSCGRELPHLLILATEGAVQPCKLEVEV